MGTHTSVHKILEAAKAVNDPANGVFGVVYPAGNFHIAQHFYMSFMFQAGGSILDKDGNLIFGTKAKDANALAGLTGQIDASCVACHKQYRPNVHPKQS